MSITNPEQQSMVVDGYVPKFPTTSTTTTSSSYPIGCLLIVTEGQHDDRLYAGGYSKVGRWLNNLFMPQDAKMWAEAFINYIWKTCKIWPTNKELNNKEAGTEEKFIGIIKLCMSNHREFNKKLIHLWSANGKERLEITLEFIYKPSVVWSVWHDVDHSHEVTIIPAAQFVESEYVRPNDEENTYTNVYHRVVPGEWLHWEKSIEHSTGNDENQ
jgi:hypothetical protein